MPLVEHLSSPPFLVGHLSSHLVFSGVRVTRSLVWCVCFVDRCLSFCPFSFGHCVVCFSLIYGFWLPFWYILAIVLSVLLWYTDSDYPCGILWPLCFLFFFDIRILITPVVSFGNCVVCSSLIYGFWLPLWYPLAIVFSVLLWYTDSDYPCGIFWQLCCMFFFDRRILITLLVYFGHCVVCSSLIDGFWLPLWYLLAIVLSVLLRYTDIREGCLSGYNTERLTVNQNR
jgi:hypothetical protein